MICCTRHRFKAAFIVAALCALGAVSAGATGIGVGPYQQNVSRDAITIIWWTDFSAAGNTNRVEYGDGLVNIGNAVETNEPSFSSSPCHYKQEARLTNLLGNTVYSYRVRSDNGGNAYTSAVFSFRTASSLCSNIHFALLGDGRTDNTNVVARHKAVYSNAFAYGASFAIENGDMVLAGSSTTPASDTDWGIFLTNVLCAGSGQNGCGVGNRIPVYLSVGNHEIYRAGAGNGYAGGNLTNSMARFKAVCANPANGSTNANWEERYYAFAYGPCYFICLDANETSPPYRNHDLLNPGDTPDWGPGSEQYLWMLGQLEYARTHAAFTFVFFHVAPYCRGVHGTPDPAIDTQRGYEVRVLDPVFRSNGVDGVFCSHDHLVERCVTGPAGFQTNYPGGMTNVLTWQDEDNLNYFVQGNSGKESRTAQAGWTNWMSIASNGAAPFYTAYFYDWDGNDNYSSFNDVDIAYNAANHKWRATFRVIRLDLAGNLTTNDEFYIERKGITGIVPGTNRLSYSGDYGGANPAGQYFVVSNLGPGALSFSNVVSFSAGATGWFTPGPQSGIMDPCGPAQVITGSVIIAGLNAGTYYATNNIFSDTATNSPLSISIMLTINKINQTIAFPAIADQALTSTVHLAATASSGLPVSFAVGFGPGTISGDSNLTFSATGMVSIVASHAGNSNYNAAPSVTNSFRVTGVSTTSLAAVSSGVCADYDGDGKADPAVYLPAVLPDARSAIGMQAGDEATPSAGSGQVGTWKVKLSSAGYYEITTTLNGLGGPGWASVSADYDGDGKADPAVYQETTGRWIILPSSMGYAGPITLGPLGGAGYSGMPADYDGDLLADPGIYQRTTGNWQVMLSSSGYSIIELLGLLGGPGYRAVAADYDGDLKGDPAIYGENSGLWVFKLSGIGYVEVALAQALGGAGYIPVPADYDGDVLADPAVRSETNNEWIVMFSSCGYVLTHLTLQF